MSLKDSTQVESGLSEAPKGRGQDEAALGNRMLRLSNLSDR